MYNPYAPTVDGVTVLGNPRAMMQAGQMLRRDILLGDLSLFSVLASLFILIFIWTLFHLEMSLCFFPTSFLLCKSRKNIYFSFFWCKIQHIRTLVGVQYRNILV